MRVRAEAKGVGFHVEFGGAVPAQVGRRPDARAPDPDQPGRQRDQVHRDRRGAAARAAARRAARRRACASRSSTRASGSPPPSAASCSAPSARPTARPRAATAAPAWVSRSPSASPTCSTARSRSRASRATAPPSVVELPAGNLDGVERVPALAANREQPSSRDAGRGAAALRAPCSSSRTGPTTSASSRCCSRSVGLEAVIVENGQQAVERVHEARAGGKRPSARAHGHADARDGRLHRHAYPAPPGLRRLDRRAHGPRDGRGARRAACRRAATTSRRSR